MSNKRKIINDPVYGFITVPCALAFDIIEHAYFQRLRNIRQLGLTCYVYPGALHTRFHHALGAMHLMTQVLDVLRSKGIAITQEESEAAIAAILLHDIGHGPFSHALEHALVEKVSHEELSLLFMERLNEALGGRIELAIRIFKGEYEKEFLHQLVSSQLDMDRLDYLNRDSFFTGVQEGVIGFERIIKMLYVHNNRIVVEHKGIYSVEQFLIARRLMYWQVYLHKTSLCAEMMLVRALERAKALVVAGKGNDVYATPTFRHFLENQYTLHDFRHKREVLEQFALIDDSDVFVSLKEWQKSSDVILQRLAVGIIQRRLFKLELEPLPIEAERTKEMQDRVQKHWNINANDAQMLVFADSTSNSAYSYKADPINVLFKDGTVHDITNASDYLNIAQLAMPVVKYYLCYPKELLLA